MRTLNISDPNAGTDQAERDSIPDYERETRSARSVSWWRNILALGAIVVLVYVLSAAIVAWFGQASQETRWLDGAIVGAMKIVPLLAVGALLWYAWRHIQVSGIVRLNNDWPVDVHHIRRDDWLRMTQDVMQRHYDVNKVWAEHSDFRSLNSLDMSRHSHNIPGLKPADFPEQKAPEDTTKAIPFGEWVPWLEKRAHVLLAAETGAGKSTLARALLARQVDANATVCILDPHSSYWHGLEGIGGGEDWPAIANAAIGLYVEYKSRLDQREEYRKRTGLEMNPADFERLFVLFDEMNNARFALETFKAPDGRDVWSVLTEVLGSGARKVNISIVGLVQSADIRDLGISAGMRNNFTIIGLDYRNILRAIQVPEIALERRRAILTALDSTEYAAVAVINGRVELLDRSGIEENRPSQPAKMWSVPVPIPENGAFEATTGTGDGDAALIRQLAALVIDGVTREDARKAPYNLTFKNAQWTKAVKLVKSASQDIENEALLDRLLTSPKVQEAPYQIPDSRE